MNHSDANIGIALLNLAFKIAEETKALHPPTEDRVIEIFKRLQAEIYKPIEQE